MTLRSDRRPKVLLYSELALYPIHWEAFRSLCRTFDLDGTAIGRPSVELPEVHRQLGWSRGEPGEIDFEPLPDSSSPARVRWLVHELRKRRPEAIWVQQEPTDILCLELLAASRAAPRTRIVGAVCENIFADTPLRIRLAGRMLWSGMDAVGAVATASIDGARRIGFPQSVRAEALVAGALSPPATSGRLELGLPAGSFVVGFVGRTTEQKGWRVLVDAAKRLPPQFAFAFAGDGPDAAALLEALSGSELAGRTRVVGLLPKHELWRFYAALDLLVVPSLTTPTWKEQFGGVLADAMAVGLPIVGSSSGSIPEVMGPAGIVVPEGDHVALADSIRQVAGDPDLQARLASAGRARFQAEFSIDAYAAKLGRLLGLT